jgi:hypothetical protein
MPSVAVVPKVELTIVTAASSNHFSCLMNLLYTLNRFEADTRKVVFNLGLSRDEVLAVSKAGVELRLFEFEQYASFVDIRRNSGCWAWKPVIITDLLTEYRGAVLWLDAGNLVRCRLTNVRMILERVGFYSPVSDGDIRKWTHPGMLHFLSAPNEVLSARNRNGAIVGFNYEFELLRKLAFRWRDLALQESCISPDGSSRANHRQDQALLSLLVALHRREHDLKLIDPIIEIYTHKDNFAAEQVNNLLEARTPKQTIKDFLAWLAIRGL